MTLNCSIGIRSQLYSNTKSKNICEWVIVEGLPSYQKFLEQKIKIRKIIFYSTKISYHYIFQFLGPHDSMGQTIIPLLELSRIFRFCYLKREWYYFDRKSLFKTKVFILVYLRFKMNWVIIFFIFEIMWCWRNFEVWISRIYSEGYSKIPQFSSTLYNLRQNIKKPHQFKWDY